MAQEIFRKSPGILHGISKLPALAGVTFDASLMLRTRATANRTVASRAVNPI
jgi:hypothetical protein